METVAGLTLTAVLHLLATTSRGGLLCPPMALPSMGALMIPHPSAMVRLLDL